MSRAKSWVADAICSAPVGRIVSGCFGQRVPNLRFPGSRIDVRSPLVPSRLAASIFFGVYESAELRFIRSRLRRDLDVVELGSSLGVVSCEIARRQEPGRKVVCVEANPELIPVLRRNLIANAPGRDAIVLNRAIDYGPDRAEVELVFGDTNLGGSTIGRQAGGRGVRTVSTCTLSGLLQSNGIGRYALVSDIEGAEAGIIREDGEALESCDQLLIELHRVQTGEYDETEESLRSGLEGHGFRVTASHGCVYLFERAT